MSDRPRTAATRRTRTGVGFADRLRWLISDRFPSVNAAAKGWAIPQPTLRRLCAGTTPRPRPATLEQIVRASGVDPHWLLLGAGPQPVASGLDKRRRFLLTLSRGELIDRIIARDVEVLLMALGDPTAPADHG